MCWIVLISRILYASGVNENVYDDDMTWAELRWHQRNTIFSETWSFLMDEWMNDNHVQLVNFKKIFSIFHYTIFFLSLFIYLSINYIKVIKLWPFSNKKYINDFIYVHTKNKYLTVNIYQCKSWDRSFYKLVVQKLKLLAI
jgi:hypothetical protein